MLSMLRRLSILRDDRTQPVTALGLVAVIALVALVCFEAVQIYSAVRQEMQTRADEEARVVTEYTERTFQAVDIVLKEVARSYELTPWTDIAESRRIWHHLRALAADLPQLRSIWMVDQNGYMRLYSGAWPTPHNDAINREYFAAQQPPFLGPYLAEPLMGKYTGRLFVPMSRAFVAGEHSFRGVVAGAVEPSYYLPELREHSVCARCSIFIGRQDGVVLVDGDAETGDATSDYARRRKLPKNSAMAGFRGQLRGFLPKQLLARQESDRYRLAVVVTVPIEAVTALWWERTNKLLLVSALAVLMLSFLLFRARRFGRDLIAARGEAERARAAHDRANQAKSEFLATMSHELRTPLNSVLGFAQLIRDEVMGPGHPRYQVYAGDIHDSGSHLLSLLNDILDLSKIEAGRKELAEAPVEVADVFASVRKLTAERASQRGVEVIFAETPLVIYADERALKQMLLNLVTNAIKFTQPGGSVSVGAALTESEIKIDIEDTGIGMTPAQLEQAQQRYGQGTPDDEGSLEGTGLGLNVSRALTELHGGEMNIESKRGVGTRVILRLPKERVLDFEGPTRVEVSRTDVPPTASSAA